MARGRQHGQNSSTSGQQREARRFQAWRLKQKGLSQKEIAAQLGVTPGAVSQWFKRARQHGLPGLKRQVPTGRPAKLTDEQRQKLKTLLDMGAHSHGFADARWTRVRVGEMIEREFGISYHPSHIARLLKSIG